MAPNSHGGLRNRAGRGYDRDWPLWICSGCAKVVSSRPFGQCYDCNGHFRRATPDDLACDRCGDQNGKRLLDRSGEFDRLCESCIRALGLRDGELVPDGGSEQLTPEMVTAKEVTEGEDIQDHLKSLDVPIHNRWVDLRSKEEPGALDYEPVELVVSYEFRSIEGVPRHVVPDGGMGTGSIEQYQVTHTKFICGSCGDTYVFVELGDWPRFCPTCGYNNQNTDSCQEVADDA